MGDLDVLTVTLALAGLVCLYGAISNRNPLDVIKLTLQGKDLSEASPLAKSQGSSPPPGTLEVPNQDGGPPTQVPLLPFPFFIPNPIAPGLPIPLLISQDTPEQYRVPYSPGNGGGAFV